MSKDKLIIPFSKYAEQKFSPQPIHKAVGKFKPPVSFQRKELNLILSIYGVMVSAGKWRDYAIDMGPDRAMFSIYRHTSDTPLYQIEKNPKLSRKQGAYAILSAEGQVLKRGRDLSQVLRLFDKKLKLVRA